MKPTRVRVAEDAKEVRGVRVREGELTAVFLIVAVAIIALFFGAGHAERVRAEAQIERARQEAEAAAERRRRAVLEEIRAVEGDAAAGEDRVPAAE